MQATFDFKLKSRIQYIQTGDSIILQEEEEDGFLCSGGLSEDQVSFKSEKDTDCEFKIYPMTQYTHAENARKKSKRQALEGQQQLEEYKEMERKQNETLNSQLDGKPVKYGQIIQLYHKRLRKFLGAKYGSQNSDITDENDSDDWVGWTEGSKKCWFDILPVMDQQNKGDKVALNEQVQLLHASSGLFLHHSNSKMELSRTATIFSIQFSDAGAQRTVLENGTAIRLFHPEAGFIRGESDLQIRAKILKRNKQLPSSYKSIWIVEVDGDKEISWSSHIRLRQITSNQYLCFSTFKQEERSKLPCILTTNRSNPNTEFALAPSNPKYINESPMNAPFFLQCANQTQSFIHVSDDFFDVDFEDLDHATEVSCQKSKDKKGSGTFTIKTVPGYQIEDLYFVQNRMPVIQDFTKKISEDCVEEDDFEKVEHILADLIKFCSISENEDPLTREGIPVKIHQKLIGTRENLKALVTILHCWDLGSAANGKNILNLVYRLLFHVVRGHQKNGVTLSELLEVSKIIEYQETMGSKNNNKGMLSGVFNAETLRTTFEAHDEKKTGGLDRKQVLNVLKELGIDKHQSKQILEKIAAGEDSLVTFPEFLVGFPVINIRNSAQKNLNTPSISFVNASEKNKKERRKGREKKFLGRSNSFKSLSQAAQILTTEMDDQEMIFARQIFSRYDVDGGGTIDEEELLFLLKDLGIPEDSEQGLALLGFLNEEGQMDFTTFLNAYSLWSPKEQDHALKGPIYACKETALPLIEMYRENQILLEQISLETICSFVKLLQLSKNPQYWKLLQIVCSRNGVAIAKNQQMVGTAIFRDPVNVETLFLKREVFNSEVQVYVEGKKYSLLDFIYRGDRSWVSYLEESIILLGEICASRNVRNIEEVQAIFDFKEAFISISTEHLPPRIRTAYASTLLHVFVNSYPQTSDHAKINTVQLCDELRPPEPLNDSEDSSLRFQKPRNLQEFLLEFLHNEINFRFDKKQLQVEQPALLLKIIELLKYSVSFGVFKRLPENRLINRFIEILEISGDYDHTGKKRTLPDDILQILTTVKLYVCEMLEYLLDRELKLGWETALADLVFEEENFFDNEEWSETLKDKILTNTAENTSIDSDKRKELIWVLLCQLRLENDQLSSKSLTVLLRTIRHAQLGRMLSQALPRVHLIHNGEEIVKMRTLQEKFLELRHITSVKMDVEGHKKATEIVDFFTKYCIKEAPVTEKRVSRSNSFRNMNVFGDRGGGETVDTYGDGMLWYLPVSESQIMMRKLGVHELILQILRLPLFESLSDSPDLQNGFDESKKKKSKISKQARTERRCVIALIQKCFDFLRFFCHTNKPNQLVIHSDETVDMLIYQMVAHNEVLCNVPLAIIEIFRDNIELCHKVTEKQIKPFIQLLTKGQSALYNSNYLGFLKAVMFPEGQYLKRIQTMILQMLLKNKETLWFLTQQGLKASETTIEKNYEISLLTIMSLSCAGRNHFTELTSQGLVSLDSCVDITVGILDRFKKNEIPEDKFEVENTKLFIYSMFLDEVYFNTQVVPSAVLLLQKNDQIWIILEYMAEFLENYAQKRSSAPTVVLENPLSLLTVEHNFDIILSFLKIFYSKFYISQKNSGTSSSQIMISENILKQLITIGDNMVCLGNAYSTGQRANFNRQRLADVDACLKIFKELDIGNNEKQSYAEDCNKLISGINVILEEVNNDIKKIYENNKIITTFQQDEEVETALFSNIVDLINTRQDDSPSFLELITFQVGNSLYVDDEFKLNCIKILQYLLKTTAIGDPERVDIQTKLASHETPLAVLSLLGSTQRNPELVKEALSLMNEMLDDSEDAQNLKVSEIIKDSIVRNFTSRGHGQFFIDISNILNGAKLDFKDKKKFLANRRQIEDNRLAYNPLNEKDIALKSKKKFGRKRGSSRIGTLRISGSAKFNKPSEIEKKFSFQEVVSYSPGNELSGSIATLYRILQLLCQGSDNVFRTLIQHQDGDQQSHDLIKQTVHILKVFWILIFTSSGQEENVTEGNKEKNSKITNIFASSRQASSSNVEVVEKANYLDTDSSDYVLLGAQFFAAMREFVRGTPKNKQSAIRAGICSAGGPINKILKTNVSSGDTTILAVKIEVVEFLLTMIDSADSSITDRLIQGLDYKALAAATELVEREGEVGSEIAVNLASSSYKLLRELQDKQIGNNPGLRAAVATSEKYCASRISRIEILEKNEVRWVYFPIPTECRKVKIGSLSSQFEEAIIEKNLNWTKPSDKIEAFMRWSEDILIKMEYKRKLETNPKSVLFVKYGHLSRRLSFLLVLVINAMLIFWQQPGIEGSEINAWSGTALNSLLIPLCATVAFFSLVTTLTFFIKRGSVINFHQWKKRIPNSNSVSFILETAETCRELLGWSKKKYLYHTLVHFAKNGMCVYWIFYLICSIAGILWPFFYVYHLFQVVIKNKRLAIIGRALIINIKSLSLLLMTIGLTLYMFSVISFVFFPKHYILTDTGASCETLLQCLASNIYFGLPTGGALIEFLAPYELNFEESFEYEDWLWIFFVVLFWFVFAIILLNVVFAIIVDTFGQLRDDTNVALTELQAACYICSIDREKFTDFAGHIEHDHSRWNYLFFFSYLKEKKFSKGVEQFSALERSVHDKIRIKDYSFFPVHRAMVFENEVVEKEDLETTILKKLINLESSFTNLAQQQLSQIENQNAEIMNLRLEFQKITGIPTSNHPKIVRTPSSDLGVPISIRSGSSRPSRDHLLSVRPKSPSVSE